MHRKIGSLLNRILKYLRVDHLYASRVIWKIEKQTQRDP